MSKAELPAELRGLPRREREIAKIVFVKGAATANDVQARLSDSLTNAAVRSMLVRLVRKGLLARERRPDGLEFVYNVAVSPSISRERAMQQLADDFFDGSVPQAAAAVLNLTRGVTGPLPIGG